MSADHYQKATTTARRGMALTTARWGMALTTAPSYSDQGISLQWPVIVPPNPLGGEGGEVIGGEGGEIIGSE